MGRAEPVGLGTGPEAVLREASGSPKPVKRPRSSREQNAKQVFCVALLWGTGQFFGSRDVPCEG